MNLEGRKMLEVPHCPDVGNKAILRWRELVFLPGVYVQKSVI